MSTQALIEKLNEILRHEWTGVAQYSQAAFVVGGLWREVYAGMFFDSAKESFGHARQIGDKIVALGGTPSVERNPVKQSLDLTEILEHGLDFEAGAVQLYNEALLMAETSGDRALIVMLEDILVEEQEGVDSISKLLREHSSAGSTQRRQAG